TPRCPWPSSCSARSWPRVASAGRILSFSTSSGVRPMRSVSASRLARRSMRMVPWSAGPARPSTGSPPTPAPPGHSAAMPQPAHFDFTQVFDADDYLHFYEETLRQEDTLAQVAFVERELGLASGSTIVDLGCGHGRHALELARRGHRVLGIDLVL